MRIQTTSIETLFVILLVLTLVSCSKPKYDERLVTTEKELNFAFTDKRGIKDENGIIYVINQDYKKLIAYADNEVKWTAEVLKICEDDVPGKPEMIGKPEIRYLKLTTDKIHIVYGKHSFASVDIRDGKVSCLGSD
jgi:hypothetical protein